MNTDQQYLQAWGARLLSSSYAKELHAVIAVQVTGQEVYWLYRCGSSVIVDQIPTLKERVDCTVMLDSGTVSDIENQRVTLQEAMLRKKMTVQGDPAKVLAFFASCVERKNA